MALSMVLRSAKSAATRAQIHRHGFPVETGLVRQFIAPAAAAAGAVGQPVSKPNPLAPSPASIARSEALAAYSTVAAAAGVVGGPKSGTTLRPLSPHLTIFKPQVNSTISISNRISGGLIVAVVLSSYLLYLKVGGVCLTFLGFYQLMFYSSKYLVPVSTEITALALAFHLFYVIRHMITI